MRAKYSLHFYEVETTPFIIRFIGAVFLTLFTILVIGILTVLLFGKIFLDYIQDDLMTSSAVMMDLGAMPVNLSSTISYRDPATGEYVEWYTLANTENRVWIDGKDIPQQFKDAVIAIEDERFWEHHGVDLKRTAGAVLYSVTGKAVFGGSTITQQLIKNLTGENQVTVKRKLTEICRALKMESNYSKDEILEWYLNVIFFGRRQYGIGAASRHYFGKEAGELSLAEICALVGITNNPSKYDPYNYPTNNKTRQKIILQKMLELGYIDQATYNETVKEPLHFAAHTAEEDLGTESYPYYVDAVIEDVINFFQQATGITHEQATTMLYYGGYQIQACVDMDIQQKMDAVYQNVENIPVTRDNKPLQSSMVVIDPETGDIVGLEGGVGEKTVARGLNWATSALGRRPPGSAIKPIAVYGPALNLGLVTPNTRFSDTANARLKGTTWYPKNDSRKNYGTVTLRFGVVHSLNTISAQVLDRLTPAVSYQFLTEKLHMNLEPGDQDYAPLAAGQLTLGTTAREMASAFTIFPTGGTFRQGRTFSRIFDHEGNLAYENRPITEENAISPKAAYWMTDLLRNAVNSGTGTGARLANMPVAGKTGTTSSNKDRWFVGYTPYYVGAVWTGYSRPARIRVSGNPAANIWKQVMALIHEGLEYKEFPVPDDISLPKVRDTVPKPQTAPAETTPPVVEVPPPVETPPAPAETPAVVTPPADDGSGAGAPPAAPYEPPVDTPPASENTPPPENFDTTPPEWLLT